MLRGRITLPHFSVSSDDWKRDHRNGGLSYLMINGAYSQNFPSAFTAAPNPADATINEWGLPTGQYPWSQYLPAIRAKNTKAKVRYRGLKAETIHILASY